MLALHGGGARCQRVCLLGHACEDAPGGVAMTPSERRRVAERLAAHALACSVAGGALLLLVLAVQFDALTRGRLHR
jgi:hypothetical protein